MSNRTKLGLNILEAALLLGVLGDALLRQTPWGINVLLWTGALVIAIYALHERWGRAELRRATEGVWLVLPILFFAAAFAWRDSATLKMLDGLALFVAFGLLAWRARGRSIRLAGFGDYALGLGHAAFNVLFASLPLVIDDVQWATVPRGGVLRHVWAVARGVVIAVPLLFLFGMLFMAADPVFEEIMQQTFQLDPGVTFSHFFLVLLFTWLVGGFLRGMMLNAEAAGEIVQAAVPAATNASYTSITIDDRERTGTDATHEGATGGHRQPPASVVVEGGATAAASAATTAQATMKATTKARGFSLGAVEVGVVLGLLNVLFACFVVVQFRYFFGGAARVMSITELTYAEYARRGFFELAWVAGLVLPLLLITHALLQRRDRPAAAERIFRPLAGTQVALLFVIMASAMARMRLYQSEYGLTELRLYTTAFMLWLGLVFVWFTWTVLVRSRREGFACGALVAAFLTVGLLHLLNPDAYIVRANAAHARAGRAFDAAYAASLSADAVPPLISAMPSLSREERCLVARELSQRWSRSVFDEDWRAWNLARSRAWRAVAAHRPQWGDATCPPPVSSVPVITPALAPETTSATFGTTTSTHAGTTNAAAPSSAPVTTTGTTNGTTNSAATMKMITETKSAAANASAAKRAKAAPRDAKNRPPKQLNRARGAKRTKAR
ncbi:MAG TPA: DUF4173 domain-containing protein [Pyrinomonadaceae bacterium]|jgi:hypothetical protein